MKSLLASAGALALMMSAAACDTAENDIADRNPPTTSADNTAVDQTGTVNGYGSDMTQAQTGTTYTLAAGEYEASDIIGASVRGSTGDDIATVSDIRLGNNGEAPMLIVRDGGVLGVGGEQRSLSYDIANIRPDADNADGEPNVFIQYTADTLEMVPAFDEDSVNDYRLASEMMGASVPMSPSGQTARIEDLILSETGEARFAVLSTDMANTDRILVDADAITVAEGDADGGLSLEIDAQALAAAPAYPRE